MNREAMERLLVVLDRTPEHDFNMNYWESCAAGHCCRDPWFIAHGLTFAADCPVPYYQHVDGFRALSRFFDLDLQALFGLFMRRGYREDNEQARWLIANGWVRTADLALGKITRGEVIAKAKAMLAEVDLRCAERRELTMTGLRQIFAPGRPEPEIEEAFRQHVRSIFRAAGPDDSPSQIYTELLDALVVTGPITFTWDVSGGSGGGGPQPAERVLEDA